MIQKLESIPDEKLEEIRRTIGEAFVSNELFHNWGSEEERRDDVLKYMALYVDFVYQAGELYANESMTGFIGLEDSGEKAARQQLKMLFRMLKKIRFSRIKKILRFAKQVSDANAEYAKERHLDVLMVCVDKAYHGQGIASELVGFAKKMSDEKGLPLLFDTDMKAYAEMYQHLGCTLYNTVTADNGVTRYNLCYLPGSRTVK
ncbi:MAG: GNAT family N-acetyltransferase [Lachnospiraceae bacterium]|nr:GNAT family N-acetyltransferase [Lachnospiraceae bacterium]